MTLTGPFRQEMQRRSRSPPRERPGRPGGTRRRTVQNVRADWSHWEGTEQLLEAPQVKETYQHWAVPDFVYEVLRFCTCFISASGVLDESRRTAAGTNPSRRRSSIGSKTARSSACCFLRLIRRGSELGTGNRERHQKKECLRSISCFCPVQCTLELDGGDMIFSNMTCRTP